MTTGKGLWWCSPIPGGLKLGGNDLQAAILGRLHASLSHTLAADPPLGLQHWLNDVLAAAAEGHAHLVVLCAPQQAFAIQPLHYRLAHLTAASPGVSDAAAGQRGKECSILHDFGHTAHSAVNCETGSHHLSL